MQKVRIALRGKAVVVMGKNTLIRKIMRDMIEGEKMTKLEALLPLVVGNMGFVFTNHNLPEIRKLILDNKVPAAAKSGSFAPADVFIPPGPTGLDPGQTNFFQALNIATKIVKGAIEIVNEVHLIKVRKKTHTSLFPSIRDLTTKGIEPHPGHPHLLRRLASLVDRAQAECADCCCCVLLCIPGWRQGDSVSRCSAG